MTTIADRVRDARIAAGLSQTGLAGDDFSPSYVSLIEAGRREPTDAALSVFAERLGSTVEFLRYGDEAPHESRIRLALDRVRLELETGDPAVALEDVNRLDLTLVTQGLRQEVHLVRASALEMTGDLDGAVAVLEPLVQEARARGRVGDAAVAATTLVFALLEAGDLHRAIEIGEEVLEAVEEHSLLGTDEHLRLASTVMGAYVERGDLIYATHRTMGLIELADRVGTPRGRGSVYWNAAILAEERHDYDLALRYTSRALALIGEGAVGREVARLRLNYAWMLMRADEPDADGALEQIERAARELEVTGSQIDLVRVDQERSRVHLHRGDLVLAEVHARAAVARLDGAPVVSTTSALLVLGDALYARGEVVESVATYRRAADMLAMMSASRQSAAVWRDLGDRFRASGDDRSSIDCYDRALRELGLRPRVPAALGEVRGSVRVE